MAVENTGFLKTDVIYPILNENLFTDSRTHVFVIKQRFVDCMSHYFTLECITKTANQTGGLGENGQTGSNSMQTDTADMRKARALYYYLQLKNLIKSCIL